MPKIQDIAGTHVLRGYIPGQATAGTPNVWSVGKAPFRCKVVGVSWIPQAAVTGAATNNFALAAQNRGAAGTGTTALTATKTYDNGVNSVAHDEEALTLSATAADLLVAEGDVLALVRTVNGTGLAGPAGTVEIYIQAR